ncbi:MAG: ABC transporter ATP-binding protein [Planctomycetes bacterium]|nr:ABC transporter ATP-binding protein [Planctomycetota bacterium]
MGLILEGKNLIKDFIAGEEILHVLKGVTLSIDPGEFVTIYGKSGAGKSTLLNLLSLLDTATSGEVYYDNKNVSRLSDIERSKLRNMNFGFVFQMYYLLPEFNLYENVILPKIVNGVVSKSDKNYILDLVEQLGLSHRITQDVRKLSGGEMQRACIVRALSTRPKILFCDEPTGNLDAKNAADVWSLIKTFNEKEKLTVIVVTHDERALPYSTRILKIENGLLA